MKLQLYWAVPPRRDGVGLRLGGHLVLGGQAKQWLWQPREVGGPLQFLWIVFLHEHCWAASGLCPLALGYIALCLQL